MKSLKALLLPCNWDYCVLDEGQRIRNPDAEVGLAGGCYPWSGRLFFSGKAVFGLKCARVLRVVLRVVVAFARSP